MTQSHTPTPLCRDHFQAGALYTAGKYVYEFRDFTRYIGFVEVLLRDIAPEHSDMPDKVWFNCYKNGFQWIKMDEMQPFDALAKAKAVQS